MRAMNIAVFIIILQMSIGFMSGIGYYQDGHLYYAPSQSVPYVVTAQDNSSTGTFTGTTESTMGAVDYLTFGMTWITAGLRFIITLMQAFFFISWLLYTTYHVPMVICVFVQGLVYMIYTWAIIQWQSGRGGGGFE